MDPWRQTNPWKTRGIVVVALLCLLSLYDHWTLRSEVDTLRAIAITASAHAAANSLNCGGGLPGAPKRF